MATVYNNSSRQLLPYARVEECGTTTGFGYSGTPSTITCKRRRRRNWSNAGRRRGYFISAKIYPVRTAENSDRGKKKRRKKKKTGSFRVTRGFIRSEFITRYEKYTPPRCRQCSKNGPLRCVCLMYTRAHTKETHRNSRTFGVWKGTETDRRNNRRGRVRPRKEHTLALSLSLCRHRRLRGILFTK